MKPRVMMIFSSKIRDNYRRYPLEKGMKVINWRKMVYFGTKASCTF